MSAPTTETLDVRVEQNKERLDKHEKLIDGIRNRLPNWALLVISALTAAIGVMIGGLV